MMPHNDAVKMLKLIMNTPGATPITATRSTAGTANRRDEALSPDALVTPCTKA